MIAFRWGVASGGAPHPFTDEALRAIFGAAAGMPRETAILADNCLLLAFHRNSKIIDADVVREVASDRTANLARKEAA